MKLTALIITPTRELALQINKHLVSVAGGITKKIMTIVGGMSVQKQERLISLKPDIVIATPVIIFTKTRDDFIRCLLPVQNLQRLWEQLNFLWLMKLIEWWKRAILSI